MQPLSAFLEPFLTSIDKGDPWARIHDDLHQTFLFSFSIRCRRWFLPRSFIPLPAIPRRCSTFSKGSFSSPSWFASKNCLRAKRTMSDLFSPIFFDNL